MTTEKYPVEQGVIISDGVQDGSNLIDKMLDVAFNLSTYSADYHMKAYKGKKVLEEEGTFYFSKPNLLRLEVKKGERKGSLAIFAKDGKIHGHLGGLMKYFNGSISPDSGLARTINDFPMTKTDFYSLVAYLKNMLKEGDFSLVTSEARQTSKFNRPVNILDMCASVKPKPLLLKRIYVDPTTYLPVFWEDYSKGKIFSESNWQNVHLDLKLPNNFFRL